MQGNDRREMQVTNDGATILKAIGVDNAAAKILVGKSCPIYFQLNRPLMLITDLTLKISQEYKTMKSVTVLHRLLFWHANFYEYINLLIFLKY